MRRALLLAALLLAPCALASGAWTLSPVAAVALPPAVGTVAGGLADALRAVGWGCGGALLLVAGGVAGALLGRSAPRPARLYGWEPPTLPAGETIDATWREVEDATWTRTR